MLFMAIVLPTWAQDIMRYGDGCYYYNPIISYLDTWRDSYLTDWQAAYLTAINGAGYEYVLPVQTTIFGIAVTSSTSANGAVYLYKKVNNEVVLIDSIADYSNVTRFMYSARDVNGNVYDDTVPCYEYMFREPYVLSDTIYLGYSTYGTGLTFVAFDHSNCQNWINLNCLPSIRHFSSSYWGGLFPIIQNGCDGCPEVFDVNYTKVGNNAAIVQWEADESHSHWQICYGPQGFIADTTQSVVCMAPHRALTGLSPTEHYDVYIRALCRCCGKEMWSQWNGPYDLYLPAIGIDNARFGEESWSLTPNPSHSNATVRCDVGMMSVELLSVKGDIVQHHDLKGDTVCTLDLAGIAKGVYVVVIATPLGSSSRRLVVIR